MTGGAGLAFSQGDYGRARALATQALAGARTAGAAAQETVAQNMLGLAAMRQQDYDVARRHLEESLSLADKLGLVDVVAAKLNLGVLALESGEPGAAVPFFEDVLGYHRRHAFTQALRP